MGSPSNWFNPKIHAAIIEAGVCTQCTSHNDIHKYNSADVRAAYVYFYDLWVWEDSSTRVKSTMDLLERTYNRMLAQDKLEQRSNSPIRPNITKFKWF